MNETHKVRLADVCDAILTGPFGSSLHQSDYISNGIPIINPQNIVNGRIVPDADKTVGEETRSRLSEFTVRENDIVIARRGEMGRCAIVTTEMNGWLCGTGSFVIRVNSSALASFVALAISSPTAKEFLEENAIGVTLKNLNQQVLGDLEIPLPPLEEQQRIVAEIEGYQKVLDGARQILEAYQPDFQIDPDWQMTPLGVIADVKLGKMLDKTKHRSGRMMPYLRNINVRWGNIETHDLLEMFYEEKELERFGLTAGDVLVCEGGEPGRSAVWDGSLPDLKYQKALHRVRFKVPYEPKLLVYFLQALAKTKEWENRFHGATIKHFTREMFIELSVPLPPLTEQRRIVAELDAEAAQMEAVRSLIPRFEAKIQRVLDRVWGSAKEE